MTVSSVEQLEKELAHTFSDKTLIKDALTHSSTGNESNYERLEFLGDRVLGLIVAELLFERFPGEREGDLAKRLAALVQGSTLAKMAQKIQLGSYIDFSAAEAQAGGAENENILADVFEAVMGALYQDSGFQKCRDLIERLWADDFFNTNAPPQHPKTELQEWAQAQGLPLPMYEIVDQTGPDHAPVFDIKLSIKGHSDVIAKGASRQQAEKEAAKMFLENLGNKA